MLPADRRLTIREVAERLRASPRRVLGLIESGALRAINCGLGAKRPRWVVDAADLERFENARASAPAPVERRRVRREAVPNYFG